MFSKQFKLNTLKNFYFNTKIKDIKTKCPFGKEHNTEENGALLWVSCSELCGFFPELGDCRKGCPCEIFGPTNALNNLKNLLIKEGYLDSNGNNV